MSKGPKSRHGASSRRRERAMRRFAVLAIVVAAVLLVGALTVRFWPPPAGLREEVAAIRSGRFAALPFSSFKAYERHRSAIEWLARRPWRPDRSHAAAAFVSLVRGLRECDHIVTPPGRAPTAHSLILEMFDDWVAIAHPQEGRESSERLDAFLRVRPADRRMSPNDPWWGVATDYGVIPEEYLFAKVAVPVSCPFPIVAWSPDGASILCAPGDGSVGLIDVVSGTFRALTLAAAGRDDGVWDVAWTRDGDSLLVSTRGGGLWDVSISPALNEREIARTVRRFDQVSASDDGRLIYAVDQINHVLHTIDLSHRKPPRTTRLPGEWAHVAPLSDGAACVATTTDGLFWLGTELLLIGRDWGSGDNAPAAWGSLDNSRWAVRDADQLVLGSGPDPTRTRRADCPAGGPTCMAFSPDGRWLAVSCLGPSWLALVDVQAARIVWVYTWLGGRRVHALTWSPDSAQLASGHTDGVIRIWSLPEFAASQKPP